MPEEPAHLVGLHKVCPRCQCTNLKFLFYNNRSVSQPRYKCLGCSKDFTLGGRIRERNAQQKQPHPVCGIGGIDSQGTIGAATGEAGPSDRTRTVREVSGADGIAVCSEVRRSDRLAPTSTELQVVAPESLPQNPPATAFPPGGGRGVVENAIPVTIPRFGDEVIVEGAANIWVKAVLGSAPFDLTRVPHSSPTNNRTTRTEP